MMQEFRLASFLEQFHFEIAPAAARADARREGAGWRGSGA
jgi:hypothetical protein